MRLNLGSGHDRRPGWRNVDKVPDCNPDEVVDLERFPWPWPDSSVAQVLMRHVLEHLGAATDTYLGLIKELWRVCRPDARVEIVVPHPRHDQFLHDPTHVRPITAQGLEMFSKRKNRQWITQGLGNTPLGLYLNVDFEIEAVNMVPDEPWRGQLQRGEISSQQLAEAARRFNNVIVEQTITLRVVKEPA